MSKEEKLTKEELRKTEFQDLQRERLKLKRDEKLNRRLERMEFEDKIKKDKTPEQEKAKITFVDRELTDVEIAKIALDKARREEYNDVRDRKPSEVDELNLPGMPPPPPGMKRFIIEKKNTKLNTEPWKLEENIFKSIRRMLPQICMDAERSQEIIITGGGPSLKTNLNELRDLVFEGKKIFATNGSANFLVDNNIRPSAVVIVDARPFNARFVEKPIPQCKYFIGSQCDYTIFDKVQDRETFIFHVVNTQKECDILDAYYGSNWFQVVGGSTVVLRTIMLARLGGYRRMHLFGFDSCYMDGEGHSYKQEENQEEAVKVEAGGKNFICSGWHYNQLEHFVTLIKDHGDKFQLSIHGDGLVRQVMEADLVYKVEGEIEEEKDEDLKTKTIQSKAWGSAS